YREVRGAWAAGVLALSGAQVSRVGGTLSAAALRVSAIGSPIGKIGIEEDFAGHVDRMRRAADVAQALQPRYIRVFSFFTGGNQPAQDRDEVLRRVGRLAAIAADADPVLLTRAQ